jgi:hypothetical protein
VLFDLLTDVSLQDNGITHTGSFTRRGGTVEDYQFNPPELLQYFGAGVRRFLYSGPGWKDHAFPAPATNLPHADL